MAERELQPALEAIATFCHENEGVFTLAAGEDGKWSSMLTWGREAPDSPMAAAQALGQGDSPVDAVYQVMEEAKIEVGRVRVTPAPAKIENPEVGDRVLIAGVDSLAGQIGVVTKVYENREIVHVKLEAGGATVSALAQDLYVPGAESSGSLWNKAISCREAAKRAADPVVRDAFNEAAEWFEERAGALPPEGG